MNIKSDRIEDLFVQIEQIFSLAGIWPAKPNYFRFTIYMMYFISYLVMAYGDLYQSFGNLELMIMNLVESVAYTITFSMVWLIHCSGLLKCIVAIAKKDIAGYKLATVEEEEIYYAYHNVSKVFLKVATTGITITVLVLYFRPLIRFAPDDEKKLAQILHRNLVMFYQHLIAVTSALKVPKETRWLICNFLQKFQQNVTLYSENIPIILLHYTNNRVSQNYTETFRTLPFRVWTFFDLSNRGVYIFMYIYLFPMAYVGLCHMTSICILIILVFHICGELAVLSYRIRNIGVHPKSDVHSDIRTFTQIHLKILWMAKSLDDTFNVILLDELLGNSIVLAISMYYVLMNIDIAHIATCFTFVFFAFTALVMLYGYCLIGEQLTEKSMALQEAYYECNWQGMTRGCKKSLLICMARAQVLLYLTAGKFYIFSLNGFTDVIKTSLAYLSMLRSVL